MFRRRLTNFEETADHIRPGLFLQRQDISGMCFCSFQKKKTQFHVSHTERFPRIFSTIYHNHRRGSCAPISATVNFPWLEPLLWLHLPAIFSVKSFCNNSPLWSWISHGRSKIKTPQEFSVHNEVVNAIYLSGFTTSKQLHSSAIEFIGW